MKIKFLHRAKKTKFDEYYTTYEDIEKEINCYSPSIFNDKIIYCNCDDYRQSNFVKYFVSNFNKLKLKKVIATNYSLKNKEDKQLNLFDDLEPDNPDNNDVLYIENAQTKSFYFEYDGKNQIVRQLNGNGDFRSNECIEILKKSDIIITNPPFSLLRDFIDIIMEYQKKFLIVSPQSATGYKKIFNLIAQNKICIGHTTPQKFYVPLEMNTNLKTDNNKEHNIVSLGFCYWLTNLPLNLLYKKHLNCISILSENFDIKKFKKYDNYDAINIDKIKNIPFDYDGVMGVPLNFLEYYHPNCIFEIVGFRKGNDGKDLRINGKDLFTRILIKRKK